MLPDLEKIKGVHPGAVLRRELKLQGLKANYLADSIYEHKQTISALLNKRRSINPSLSIKLAKFFQIDYDYFMLLQASYDVEKASTSQTNEHPNLEVIRKAIFWDTTFDKIDWQRNRKAIIKRVFERGNKQEIDEIIKFYGKVTVRKELELIGKSYLPSFKKNIAEHNFL